MPFRIHDIKDIEKIKGEEFYSENFHQDGYIMIYNKIFINMMDIRNEDGPLEVIPLENRKSFFNDFNYKDRHNYKSNGNQNYWLFEHNGRVIVELNLIAIFMFAKVMARKIILGMKFLLLKLIIIQLSLFPIKEVYSSKESVGSQDRFEKFSKSMQGVRFTGFFTVDGSGRPPSEETYEIHSVQKFLITSAPNLQARAIFATRWANLQAQL